MMGGRGLDTSGGEFGPVVGGSESSGSKNGGKCLD
jgi:hypothetical protein